MNAWTYKYGNLEQSKNENKETILDAVNILGQRKKMLKIVLYRQSVG